MNSRVRARAGAVGAVLVVMAAVAALAQAASVPANESEIGWLSGHPVQLLIHHPTGPGQGPNASSPNANIFLIAPVDPRHPDKKGSKNPAPPGFPTPFVIVPYHDTVLPRTIPASNPANCYGEYVEMGARGTRRTVLTRRDPEGSGLVLAYALVTKHGKQPLTSQALIKAAVAKRLLKLDPSLGYGGYCWTGKRSSKPAPLSTEARATRASAVKQAPPTRPWRTVRTFTEVTTQFYFGLIPVPGQAAGTRGAGDELFSTGALYSGKRKVGENLGSCLTVADSLTAISPTTGLPVPTPSAPANLRADCRYMLRLAGGTLVIGGLFDQTAYEGGCAARPAQKLCSGATQTLAVLGGTGRFVGAVGQLQLTQIRYPAVSRLVLELR